MSNSISWLGNRVVDTSAARPAPRTTAQTLPRQATLGEPITEVSEQGPPPSTEPGFIPYYLSQNIGRNVRAEFIIGSNQYHDKTGKLIEVGINYFVLDDVNSRTHVMCDLYSVKFVTILQYDV